MIRRGTARSALAATLVAGAAALAAALGPGAAHAQNDVRMIRPNVLLLLDTSGSMEWRTGVANTECTGADGGPCNRCSNGATICSASCPEGERRNRWATSIEVLTGTIQNFSCAERQRVDPFAYDHLYPIEYHEPLSNGLSLWAPGAVQAADGVLDTYRDRVRFGLMTFDNDYGTGTGANNGMYSYGPDRPFRANGCPTPTAINVGARRASADEVTDPVPGGLVSVGSPYADPAALAAINDRIQTSIVGRATPTPQPGIRPYGGTPIAALLDDAYHYWTSHPDVTRPSGSTGDPLFNCRGRFNILVTDGAPNMDFRPACEGGDCPYALPAQTALRMAMTGGAEPGAKTWVIAFNASDAAAASALEEIAVAGGTGAVLYANRRDELRTALSTVLDAIAAQTSTRTAPAFGLSAAGTSGSTLYQFFSSFAVSTGAPWEGVLERRRTECAGAPPAPVDRDIDRNVDDFGFLLRHSQREARGWGSRRLWTFVPPGATSPTELRRTLQRTPGEPPAPRTIVDRSTPPSVFGLSTNQDRDTLVAWLHGERGTVRENRPLGDIFHSNPLVLGPPATSLPDQTFAAYRRRALDTSATGTWRRQNRRIETREQVVYVGTNDGILHAFEADTGEEIWGFVPPYLTGSIPSMIPSSHQYGVDGTPVARELMYVRSGTALGNPDAWRTVLVVGLRGGGGAYEALDVTDPYNPRFLWQFTDSDLAEAYAMPGLGSVFTTWNSSTGERVERAVAVLPGGTGRPESLCPSGASRPARTDPRIQNEGTRGTPRGTIRCWQSGRGQYLYVVDVETGRLIRKFGPTGSPLVGSPALYIGTEGSVATRAYVGDADGGVWRLDMSDADPENWRFSLLFDVFYDAAWNAGQPVVSPPVVSVDAEGATLIAVGSGDPDLLEGTERNRVAVYRERLALSAGGVVDSIRVANNWEIRDGTDATGSLRPGERLTGAMSLFNGVLYFGTFVPTSSLDQCMLGYSRLWGLDQTALDGALPAGRLDVDGDPLTTDDVVRVTEDINGNGTTLDDANSVLFGVGIVRRPSCVTTAEATDPYLPPHRWVDHVAGGDFRLVAQTGRGGSSSGGLRTNVVSRRIPPPLTETRVDAWAVVFE